MANCYIQDSDSNLKTNLMSRFEYCVNPTCAFTFQPDNSKAPVEDRRTRLQEALKRFFDRFSTILAACENQTDSESGNALEVLQ